MSSRRRTERAARALAATMALGTLLGACSDLYYDRRETIALGADDAVAANLVAQMVDPWPPHSNNKNLAFNAYGVRSENRGLSDNDASYGVMLENLPYRHGLAAHGSSYAYSSLREYRSARESGAGGRIITPDPDFLSLLKHLRMPDDLYSDFVQAFEAHSPASLTP